MSQATKFDAATTTTTNHTTDTREGRSGRTPVRLACLVPRWRGRRGIVSAPAACQMRAPLWRSFAYLVRLELEHALHEGERRIRRGEGRHVLARVRREAERVEAGHDETLRGRDEAKEADHREAAVVDLREELLLLLLGRELLGEAEGVEEVERHRVRDHLEARVEARLAAAHVVLLALRLEDEGGLAPHLEEADSAKDLQLGRRRERVPLVHRAARRRDIAEGDRRRR